jgi:hypothetical protein
MNKPTVQLLYEKSKSFFILNNEMKNDLLNKKRKKKLKTTFDELFLCLGNLELSDLGIEDVEPFTEHHLFMPIFESDLFVISLFVLPEDSKGLPFHNHPEMTVITKFLYGKAKMTTAELIKPTFGTIGSEKFINSIF